MAARYPSMSPDNSESDEEEIPESSTNIPSLLASFPFQPGSTTTTEQLVPSSDPGVIFSSPVTGTKAQRQEKRRHKNSRKQKQKAEAARQDTLLAAEALLERNLLSVQEFMKSTGVRFGQYLAFISDPSKKQGTTRWREFFQHKGEATKVLNWWASTANGEQGREEVSEWAIQHVVELVAQEARSVTQEKLLQTAGMNVDEDFVNSFSYLGINKKLQESAPTAIRVLTAFATSPRSDEQHTERRKGRTKTVITSTALSCLEEYSHSNNLAKRMMGLYLYATGAQRQTISVLSTLGLCESYTNIITSNLRKERKKKTGSDVNTTTTTGDPLTPKPTAQDASKANTNLKEESTEPYVASPIPTVKNESPIPTSRPVSLPPEVQTPSAPVEPERMPRAPYTGTLRQISWSMRRSYRSIALMGLYATIYDNINLMFRNAEQLIGRHDSQENGTCVTLIPLWDASLVHLKVEDYRARFLSAEKLLLTDILPTKSEVELFRENLIFSILRIIIKNGGDGFKKFEKDLEKHQPDTPDKIKLHKTPIHPLPTWNIDESSINGNIEVDAAIVKELEIDKDPEFWQRLRFHGGDQLSLARFRAIENIRAGQEYGYNAFFGSVWLPGLFHGKMADATGTLLTHWGKPNTGSRNPGSLWFHNTRLDRLPITLTSLPTFRVCRDLIFVSLYARILHCLLLVANVDTLENYLTKHGTWSVLRRHAEQIHDKYAATTVASDLRQERARMERESAAKESADGGGGPSKKEDVGGGDVVFENAVLFMRDALISREFSDAIKAGDSGRVVLVLKTWALSFRGSGRSKYAHEMLHLIHNLTKVWSPEVRKIVLNNWLVNPTGLPNSWVEVDLMQEHINYWIKVFYKAHGTNATWEWIEWISPCVEVLRKLTRSFNDILGSDQGTRHAPADLSNDIQSLMDSLRENEVYQIQKGRTLADEDDGPVKDVITSGLESLCDGSKNPISEYNGAFARLQTRRRMKPVIPGAMAAAKARSEGDHKAHSTTTHPSNESNIKSPTSASELHPNTRSASAPLEDIDESDEAAELEEPDIFGDVELEPMVTLTTAADVDLDMDDVEVEYEESDEESDEE